MKITNIEKLQGWTPPGNPSINPIVTEVDMGIFDYTFWIRYHGRSYEAIILRDYETSEFGKRYRIEFKLSASPMVWQTWINIDVVKDMRIFYDTLHRMLHRIVCGKFEDHYGTK